MALLAILTGLSMVTAATLTAGPAIPSSGTAPVTDEQTAAWRREVLPLPKELRIESVLELHPGAVGIRAAGPGNALVVQAVKELRTVFQDKAGVPPDGRVFEIVVGLLVILVAGVAATSIMFNGLDNAAAKIATYIGALTIPAP